VSARDTWGDTKLDGAGCGWLNVNRGGDFEWGVKTSMMTQSSSQQIDFQNTYTTIPKVIVWLTSIDADG
jgi:hypothetical protein